MGKQVTPTTEPVVTEAPEMEVTPTTEPVVETSPVVEGETLTLRQRLEAQMADTTSDLRNQTTPEHIVDLHLLSNTTAETICAMSGKDMEYVTKRAEEIGVTLKGTLARSMPGTN